jgi:hypothetical protein
VVPERSWRRTSEEPREEPKKEPKENQKRNLSKKKDPNDTQKLPRVGNPDRPTSKYRREKRKERKIDYNIIK